METTEMNVYWAGFLPRFSFDCVSFFWISSTDWYR